MGKTYVYGIDDPKTWHQAAATIKANSKKPKRPSKKPSKAEK